MLIGRYGMGMTQEELAEAIYTKKCAISSCLLMTEKELTFS